MTDEFLFHNNPSPWLTVVIGDAASIDTPADGRGRLFIDIADGLLKVKDSTGTVTPVGGVPPATYQLLSEKGVTDGYASLDGTAKVPLAQLQEVLSTVDLVDGAKPNYAAGVAPTASDDETQGYGRGSLWVTTAEAWICLDPTTATAVWTSITDTPPALTVREQDGTPTVANVSEIRVTDGTLTDEGGGAVSLDTGGGGGAPLTVEEQDGDPTVPNVVTIKVTNGTLTDEGAGVVSLDTGGGGGATALNDLTDVSTAGGQAGMALTQNGAGTFEMIYPRDTLIDDTGGHFPTPNDTVLLRPNADTQLSNIVWTNSGTQDAYQQIDEAVLNTADWLRVDGNGSYRCGLEDLPPAAGAVVRLRVYLNLISPAASFGGACQLHRTTQGDNSANIISWGQNPAQDQFSSWLTTNPFTGLAWTVADVNDLEIRVYRSSGSLNATTVRQAYMEVEYSSGVVINKAIQDLADGTVSGLTVEEADGDPSVAGVNTIKLQNAVLVDEGSGVVNIEPRPAATAPYEIDYAEITSAVTVTGLSEAAATTVVTGAARDYDGVTEVLIAFQSPYARPDTVGGFIRFALFEDGVSLGLIGLASGTDTDDDLYNPISLERRLTPSAGTHTYEVRAFVNTGSGQVAAGAGGVGNYVPAFLRITTADAISELGVDVTCLIENSGVQAVPATTPTALTFDTDVYDPHGMHNPGVNPSRITVAEAGRYDVTAGAYSPDNTTLHIPAFAVNGVTVAPVDYSPGTSFGSGFNLTGKLDLNAGDYVEIVVYNIGAVDWGDSVNANQRSWFGLSRIGGLSAGSTGGVKGAALADAGPQSIADTDGITALQFAGAAWDDYDWHDPLVNNSRVTVDRDCRVHVSAQVQWDPNTNGDPMFLGIYKNGVLATERANGFVSTVNSQPATNWQDAWLDLVAGDYVEAKVQHYLPGARDFTNMRLQVVTVEVAGGGGGGGGASGVLYAAPSDETILAHDEFDDDDYSGWTGVHDTGASGHLTFREAGGILGANHDNTSDGANIWHGMMKPIGGTPSHPLSLQGGLSLTRSRDVSFAMFGICLADGTTHGSGKQIVNQIQIDTFANDGFTHIGYKLSGYDTADGFTTSRLTTGTGIIHLKIEWYAANSFRVLWSMDGIAWYYEDSTAELSHTMSPTHYGLVWSNYNTSLAFATGAHYLRVVDDS